MLDHADGNIDVLLSATERPGVSLPLDPGAPSAFSHARLAGVTDLNGVRIELAELTPDSLQRKAMDSWK